MAGEIYCDEAETLEFGGGELREEVFAGEGVAVDEDDGVSLHFIVEVADA